MTFKKLSAILLNGSAALLVVFATSHALAQAPEGKSESDVFLDDGSTDDFGEPIPSAEAPSRPEAQSEATADAVAKSIGDKASKRGKKAAKAPKAAKPAKPVAPKAIEAAEKNAEEAAGPLDGADQPAATEPAATEEAEPKAAAKSSAPAKKKKAVKEAKPTAGKGAFKTTKTDCAMQAKASAKSAKLTDVAAGKRIWVERAGAGWYKVFRRKGAGYLAASCF